jgi:antitoxin StbD
MEQLLASHSVSITELKRSPSAVMAQAGLEPVAILNHNRPAAYLVPPQVYEAMLERLNADLRAAIRDAIESGPAIPAADLFDELNAGYAEPAADRANLTGTQPS